MTNSPLLACVCGRREVRGAASRHEVTAAVSLVDVGHPMAKPFRVHRGKHLVLAFEDTHDESLPSSPQARHMNAVLRHVDSLGATDRLLVHCEAGLSRSTAVALALLARTSGTQAAAEELRRMRPEATPNRLVARLMDEACGFGGALMAAAESFPRPVWDR